jgi:hypothetical protein
VSIQVKPMACLVILASSTALVGCEWITRVDSAGYRRVVAKDGKELFCQNVVPTDTGGWVENPAWPGFGVCYTRRQLWDKQNQDSWADLGMGTGLLGTTPSSVYAGR